MSMLHLAVRSKGCLDGGILDHRHTIARPGSEFSCGALVNQCQGRQVPKDHMDEEMMGIVPDLPF